MNKRFKLKGYFKFQDNSLFYHSHLKEKDKTPHKLKILGRWSLDKNHNLLFIVDESQNKIFGNTLRFATKIESVSKDYLEISLLKRLTPTFKKIKRINLKGCWKTDNRNKLIFCISRDKEFDEIAFGNEWDIDENNQIIYIYKRTFAKKEVINSFVLKGSWKFKNNKLIYQVENSSMSALSFRVSLNRQVINPRTGKLDFILGMGIGTDKQVLQKTRTISLSGKWQKKGTSLEFVTEFRGKIKSWHFKINKKLSPDKEIIFQLTDAKGKALGFEVIFLKKFLKEGYFLIRAKKTDEKRIEGGVYLPF